MNKQVKKVYWELKEVTAQGDIILRIPNIETQRRIEEMEERSNKRLEMEKRRKEALKLDDMEEFDELIDELLTTDAVYMVANRNTGKNLRVDWDALKKELEGTDQVDIHTERKKRQGETVTLNAVGVW